MLIGLHGKKRSGKDAAYARISKLYGSQYKVRRASFADLLYESAAEAVDVTVGDLQDYKSDPYIRVQVVNLRPFPSANFVGQEVISDLTIREFLQRYGTEAHRDVFGDDFWVDQVDLFHGTDEIVVCTDVRFENEARAILRSGGVVVQVLGPDDVEGADDTHASETPLPEDLVTYRLDNSLRTDDFENLDNKIQCLLELVQVPA